MASYICNIAYVQGYVDISYFPHAAWYQHLWNLFDFSFLECLQLRRYCICLSLRWKWRILFLFTSQRRNPLDYWTIFSRTWRQVVRRTRWEPWRWHWETTTLKQSTYSRMGDQTNCPSQSMHRPVYIQECQSTQYPSTVTTRMPTSSSKSWQKSAGDDSTSFTTPGHPRIFQKQVVLEWLTNTNTTFYTFYNKLRLALGDVMPKKLNLLSQKHIRAFGAKFETSSSVSNDLKKTRILSSSGLWKRVLAFQKIQNEG